MLKQPQLSQVCFLFVFFPVVEIVQFSFQLEFSEDKFNVLFDD